MIFFPYRLAALAGLLLITTPFTRPLAAAQPTEVAAEVGRYSILDADKGAEAGWELRFAPRRFRLQPRWLPDVTPMGGAMATARGSLYAYAGFGLDLTLGHGWFLRPSWAAGLFHQQRDLHLGGPVEFRSALELSHRLKAGARLGLVFYHLSNGGLYRRNPGTESLVVTFVARP